MWKIKIPISGMSEMGQWGALQMQGIVTWYMFAIILAFQLVLKIQILKRSH